jgi:hypothetical protein
MLKQVTKEEIRHQAYPDNFKNKAQVPLIIEDVCKRSNIVPLAKEFDMGGSGDGG